MDLNESRTRVLLIDPALRAADWPLNDRSLVKFEVPVDGYDAEPWNCVTDYCLYDSSGNVLAVVEAKRCSRNPREADEQLRHYVTQIALRQSFAPFGFMANGHDTWFWEVGLANPRLVAGFFTPADLARLNFLRQTRFPLESTAINSSIVDRPYQHEAIRRVAEAFAANKRRALLVMATGTGKTRTTMALIDVFLRANQARHVLFLADRDALVDQTLTDGFKAHLPHEPRDRIYTHQVDKDKRLFVATEQTMALCYGRFSPGFFDLIVFDEAHRSLFRRFSEVIEYFDARMIGLTATPASFIERDTFRLFGCDANAPTFQYDYQQAVRDQFLVDFSLYQAQTGFQRKGIKGVDLSEEDRNALIEQGIDPDALDYEGTEIEVEVSNTNTLRKQWEEVMEVCLKDQSGQLPGKTIVFAMTKKHAGRIAEVFEEMYPQHVGLVQVITSTTERVRDGSYGDGLISKFKRNDFLPAAFRELFGEPLTLMRKWERRPFAELLVTDLQNGLSPSTAGKITARVLTLSAITRGAFDSSASKLGQFNAEPPKEKRVRATDFLICRGNGNLGMVGSGKFPPNDMINCVFPDTMIAAQVNADLVCRPFLESVWRSPALRKQIEASARTTNGTHKINQEVLEEMEIPVPPLALQQRFAALVERVERLRLVQRESLRQAEHLFASLLHRAFLG